MKRIIALLLALSLCFGLAACGANRPSKAEDVAEYALRAVFVWGDEPEQLLWLMPPSITEDAQKSSLLANNYQQMMNNLVGKGYQYCEYRLDSYYKLSPDDPDYIGLSSEIHEKISAIRGYCYVVEHPTTDERLIAVVHLAKIRGQWYVLRVGLSC